MIKNADHLYLPSIWWIQTIQLCLSTHYTSIYISTSNIDLFLKNSQDKIQWSLTRGGCLRESNHRSSPLKMDLNTSATFWHGKLLLHTFCELQLYVQFHSLYTLREVVHIEEKGPHQASSGRLQEVKKLIMENYEIIRPKSGCSHL